MTAKVSVVIPAYNCASYIANAIDSVLSQRGCSIEVLVIDDGSRDGTRDVVSSYGTKVHYLHQENQGAAAARNKGLQLATGNYIAFLDSDDTWYPDKLAVQINILDYHPEYIATFSNFHIVDQKGEITHSNGIQQDYAIFKVENESLRGLFDKEIDGIYYGNLFPSLFLGNFINTSSILVRREVLLRAGYFDTTLVTQEDYDYWLRLAQAGQMAYIDQPLLTRSRIPGQLTGKGQNLQISLDVVTVIERYAKQAAQFLGSAITRKRLEDKYCSLAINYLTINDKSAARKSLWKALKLKGARSKSTRLLIWSFLPQRVADSIRYALSRSCRK